MKKTLRRWLFVSASAALLGWLGYSVWNSPADEVSLAEVKEPLPPPTTYATSLDKLNSEFTSSLAAAEQHEDSYLRAARVADLSLTRAQLTGGYEDYANARRWVDEAFERTDGGGPFSVRASVNLALHQLDSAQRDIDEMRRIPHLYHPAETLAMQGDVYFHSSRYDEARETYEKSHRTRPTTPSALRLAHLYWQTGDFERAEHMLDDATRRLPPSAVGQDAYIHLRRGLLDLDRGRYDEAMKHYRDGANVFSGWWLIDEHMAEIQVLQGDTESAKLAYEDLIERTGSPEFMDALSEIYAEEKQEAKAALWGNKATQVYEERLALLPAATYGHAVDHFLESDPKRALELAQADVALRPSGAARVALAQAYARVGQPKKAVQTIDRVSKSSFSTAESHGIAALLFCAAGKSKQSLLERERALAIRPSVFEELQWLSDELKLENRCGAQTPKPNS